MPVITEFPQGCTSLAGRARSLVDAGRRRLAGSTAAGEEVARARVLAVRDRRRVAPGDAGHRGDQACHVLLGGVDAAAGPDGPGHLAAVAAPDLVPVAAHVLAGVAEEPHQVRVRAEAAVPDADGVLGR